MVSVTVSFITVHSRTLTGQDGKSLPVNNPANPAVRAPDELESVLGATPHEFESRILRHSPRGHPTGVSAGQRTTWQLAGDEHTEGRFPSREPPLSHSVSV